MASRRRLTSRWITSTASAPVSGRRRSISAFWNAARARRIVDVRTASRARNACFKSASRREAIVIAAGTVSIRYALLAAPLRATRNFAPALFTGRLVVFMTLGFGQDPRPLHLTFEAAKRGVQTLVFSNADFGHCFPLPDKRDAADQLDWA